MSFPVRHVCMDDNPHCGERIGRIMGKLVLMMGVSLDGLVARTGQFGAGGGGFLLKTQR